MAHSLSSIFGSEKDKAGSMQTWGPLQQSVLLPNLYQNPAHLTDSGLNEQQLQQHFDDFFEDIFTEVATKYGEVEEMCVCDNIGDHLIGNVYIRFRYEEDAQKCVDAANDRFYAGRPVWAELTPVTDFREACCRQYEMNECTRGGFCNFMHLKTVSKALKRELYQAQREMLHQNPDPRGRALSKTPEDTRSYSPGAHGRRGGGGGFGGGGGGGGGGGYGGGGRDRDRDRRDSGFRGDRDRDRDRGRDDFRDRDRGRDDFRDRGRDRDRYAAPPPRDFREDRFAPY